MNRAGSQRTKSNISAGYFFPLLIFAHLARCAALIRARPAAEIRRLGLAVVDIPFEPLTRAHLALCAEAMRARAAADMVRPVRVPAVGELPSRDISA